MSEETNKPVDPVTDARFALFSDDDRQFLVGMFVRYPNIAKNFDRFLGLPTMLRPQMAAVDLWDVKRAGWVRRGIEDCESVRSHLAGLAHLADDYMANGMARLSGLSDEDRAIAANLRNRLRHMAKVHDLPEAIVTDFTPHDPISTEDKHRLELLAAKVIFEHPQFAYGLYNVTEYVEQQTFASQLLHDFDKIHAVRGALYYETRDAPMQAGLFQQFFDYALPRMKTDNGKAYMQWMQASKQEMQAEMRSMIKENRTIPEARAR